MDKKKNKNNRFKEMRRKKNTLFQKYKNVYAFVFFKYPDIVREYDRLYNDNMNFPHSLVMNDQVIVQDLVDAVPKNVMKEDFPQVKEVTMLPQNMVNDQVNIQQNDQVIVQDLAVGVPKNAVKEVPPQKVSDLQWLNNDTLEDLYREYLIDI